MRARNVYTSASANRSSQVADWARIGDAESSALVYATNRSVAFALDVGHLHPSAPSQLIATPNGLLTVVKFVHEVSGQGLPKALAASDDGWLYLFGRQHGEPSSQWHLQHAWNVSAASSSQQDDGKTSRTASRVPFLRKGKQASAGAASIRALGVLRGSSPVSSNAERASSQDNKEYLFSSAAADGMLQVWKWAEAGQQGQIELVQTLSLGQSRAEARTEVLPLDIAMTRIPSTKSAIMLLVAGTDSKIDVLLAEDGRTFQKLFSLLGHTDWVRSLDVCEPDSGRAADATHTPSLLLASGSQDHGLRLWRIARDDATTATSANGQQTEGSTNAEGVETLDEFDQLAMQIEEGEDETLATKMQMFRCEGQRWSITFDALLLGHEHWVTGVRWAPSRSSGQPAALLSSSADNSVILWTPSSCVTQAMSSPSFSTFADADRVQQETANEQDVWVAVHRFGEVGGVGSAANGMYGVAWDPSEDNDRQAVLAHGYGGAIHVWSRSAGQTWKADSGLGGHFAPASCLRWEPEGQYIASGGLDKTTRIHACFRSPQGASWHEVARPQTHGYEVVGLAWLSRLAFASAGDEKVIRVFEAPQGFVDSTSSLGLITARESSNVLTFFIPDLSHLVNPAHLTAPIKEATRRSLHQGKLDIVVVSPLFDGVEAGDSFNVSFEQAEQFLKWCYAQAWSEAVEADELLFDVDVLLLATHTASVKLECQWQCETVFVVDEKENQLPFSLANAIVLRTANEQEEHPSNQADKDDSSFPQHAAIALGGTFDHLHVGHKILLSVACLLATQRVVVGVTGASMLSKKKHASVLESTEERIQRVKHFMSKFCRAIGRTALKHDVVQLQDAAGPAGTDPDLTALLFTDETVSGADFIDGERTKRGLEKLARFTISLIGASGETDVQGEDAGALAAAKVGSTSIRGWIEEQRGKPTEEQSKAIVQKTPMLDHLPTLTGEPRPLGASVPPLGLSNRAIHGSTNEQALDTPSATGQPVGKASRSIASRLTRPPVEEELHTNSLWSEMTKVYGHPLELSAIDVDLQSGLLASSCKATQAELAGVRLHDSRNQWREVQILEGHSLGVTRIRFDKDGKRIVTVSRDRSWRVFAKKDGQTSQEEPFALQAAQEEAHSRIIYDVAWCGKDDFATVSRDGLVKIWRLADSKTYACVATMTLKQPLTAVAAWQRSEDDVSLLAVGSESGNVWIYQKDAFAQDWQLALSVEKLHADALNELTWQPLQAGDALQRLRKIILGSAGQDGAVRLTEVQLDDH